MNEMKLFEALKEAYETTTKNCNRFLKKINSIKWDSIFYADGETYYKKGCFILTVENTNPFEEKWKPTAWFSDGFVTEF